DAATEIGTVQAFVPGGATGTFTIEEDASGLFEITAAGVLSLIEGKKMDYGAAQQHTLTVSVNDGTNTRSAVITINVLENMDPTGDAQKFTVAEDIADTDAIGTVVATDPEGDALTFAMKTNDNDLFEITETGELSLAPSMSLDYETAKSHELVVTVNDGTNQVDLTVQVNVTNVVETLFDDPASFITTWKTDADGEDVGFFSKGSNLTIDWGDGQVETNLNIDGFKDHTYTSAGTYTVAIKGDLIGFSFLAIFDTPEKLVGMEQWGTAQWVDMAFMFYTALNMVYNATDVPDLSMVTSMSNMFQYATSFNGAIGNWDTSNVTNMARMFEGATSFNGAIGNWDVSNVTDMRSMFNGATSFDQDLSGWADKLGNVTDMSDMFWAATSFNGAIGNWDVSNVTNMSGMFAWAISFDQDLSGWADKLGNVIDMSSMFEGATSINGAIGNWDVSNVADMSNMFSGASSFDQSLASWEIGNVTNMQDMLDNSGMSPANLNATLIGWNNFVETNNGPDNITLGLDNIAFCGQDAIDAANNLDQTHSWTFAGNFFVEPVCP
uniref:BspA family leucine-rich repeat surface protein n=1 Tax=Flagellimonas beolgyonensis TaxID=864064 RepID=UPI000F8C7205